ncbi:hypothetical protein [Rhodopila sp.]|uniref:hypothetical protein n=1 Tax=Rhodopila sp. TaxID=2480087 RepID=UPI003D0D8036
MVTKARRRALYPEPQEYEDASTIPVTIRLDPRLLKWLREVVGPDSLTFSVNEAIVTGIRAMKGDISISTLLHVMARNQCIAPVEAMYGKMGDDARRESGLLLQAAALWAEFSRSPLSAVEEFDRIPEADKGPLLQAWQAVAPGRDIAREIDGWRAKARRALGERSDGSPDDLPQWEPGCGDFDDLIPF